MPRTLILCWLLTIQIMDITHTIRIYFAIFSLFGLWVDFFFVFPAFIKIPTWNAVVRLYVQALPFFSHSSSANISAINNLLLLCLIHLDSRKHVIEYNMAYAKLVVSNGAYLIYKQLNHWKCDREKNMQTEQKSNELEWMEKSRVFFSYCVGEGKGERYANRNATQRLAESEKFVDVWDIYCRSKKEDLWFEMFGDE